jgi:hypothetical protein
MLNNHGARNSPAGVAHQVFQQRKFFASQINAFPRPLNPALYPVELQIFHR